MAPFFYGRIYMNPIIFDVIGMAGTFLVVGAFFLMQIGKVDPKGFQYNYMNLAGAILLLISLTFNFNLASFVIEVFWIAASLIGIFNCYKLKQKTLKQNLSKITK